MVITAAYQTIMPIMAFQIVQQKAYKDYYGEYEPEGFEYDSENNYVWETKNMQNWDSIQGLNMLTWGPMLVLGCFSLSERFEDQSAWWLENVVSNLYMPVMFNETYSLLEYAFFEGTW